MEWKSVSYSRSFFLSLSLCPSSCGVVISSRNSRCLSPTSIYWHRFSTMPCETNKMTHSGTIEYPLYLSSILRTNNVRSNSIRIDEDKWWSMYNLVLYRARLSFLQFLFIFLMEISLIIVHLISFDTTINWREMHFRDLSEKKMFNELIEKKIHALWRVDWWCENNHMFENWFL